MKRIKLIIAGAAVMATMTVGAAAPAMAEGTDSTGVNHAVKQDIRHDKTLVRDNAKLDKTLVRDNTKLDNKLLDDNLVGFDNFVGFHAPIDTGMIV